jgi:hypothetical protein
MTPGNKKKLTFWGEHIRPNITLGLLVAVVGWGIAYYLQEESRQLKRDAKDAHIESRIYTTPLQYQKAVDHDNAVPNDVDNFKREIRLISQGDTLIQYHEKLDSVQVRIEKNILIVNEFFQFTKNKHISDSISESKKQISRDDRSDDIQNIGNTLIAIQNQLDTIN